jgi:hypothetical protein
VVSDPYEYDVAVSFAGPQRAYVEKFVEACRRRGLRVFYDRDMTVSYWGRNFIYEFRKVYGGSAARFVMPFISAEYLATPYPQDEFAAAVEEGFRRKGQTYLLPVVVGGVTIPPELLNPAIGWLSADDHTPDRLAELTARRLEVGEPAAPAADPPRRRRITPAVLAAGALLVAAVAVVAAVILPNRGNDPAGSAALRTTAAPSPSAAACDRQTSNAVVRPGPDSAADTGLVEASYTVHEQRGSEVDLDMSGRIRGRVGSDKVLWILGTADPTTHDSSAPPVYGSSQIHVVRQIKPDSAGCWSVTGKKVGYDCAGGLTFRYYLAALTPHQATEMDGLERAGQDGFTEGNIRDDRGIPLLSTYDVPTEANC